MTTKEQAETTRTRFSLPAWAKERGYDLAIKALSGNDCDALREAIQAHERLTERIDLAVVARDIHAATIGGYVAKLNAVKEAAGS